MLPGRGNALLYWVLFRLWRVRERRLGMGCWLYSRRMGLGRRLWVMMGCGVLVLIWILDSWFVWIYSLKAASVKSKVSFGWHVFFVEKYGKSWKTSASMWKLASNRYISGSKTETFHIPTHMVNHMTHWKVYDFSSPGQDEGANISTYAKDHYFLSLRHSTFKTCCYQHMRHDESLSSPCAILAAFFHRHVPSSRHISPDLFAHLTVPNINFLIFVLWVVPFWFKVKSHTRAEEDGKAPIKPNRNWFVGLWACNVKSYPQVSIFLSLILLPLRS